MVFVTKIQSLSSITSSTTIQLRKAHNFTFKPTCSIHYTSQHSNSPFTEKHSIERYQRDSWLYKSQLEDLQPSSCSSVPSDHSSIRDYDISMQLSELKKLLQVLKEKRGSENGLTPNGPGNVFLVGTGPGDPELLTLKALRVIQSADLLLYDRLVSNDVLSLVGPNARLLYVGKTAGYHSRTQNSSLNTIDVESDPFLDWALDYQINAFL